MMRIALTGYWACAAPVRHSTVIALARIGKKGTHTFSQRKSRREKVCVPFFSSVTFDSLDHVARDHELLDLAGAFVDAEQPHVAIEPLDAVVGHVTGAAVDLHRAIGDTPAHLGGEILAARRLG